MLLTSLLILAIGYLLGSMPNGYLAGRWLKGIDLRQCGSGSTGATNVLRNVGKGPALVVFLLDVGKGRFGRVTGQELRPQRLGCRCWRASQPWPGTSGRCGWAGKAARRWPLDWGSFSASGMAGGSGQLGDLYGCDFSIFRIVSLSSVVAAIGLPVLMVLAVATRTQPRSRVSAGGDACWCYGAIAATSKRLIAGTEPKIGQKA